MKFNSPYTDTAHFNGLSFTILNKHYFSELVYEILFETGDRIYAYPEEVGMTEC